MDKVVLTEHLDDAAGAWLAERVRLVRCPLNQAEALERELADAAGLLVRTYTQVNTDLLDKAPRLKVVGRAGVGLDNIDVEACRQRGVRVVYTPNANTQAVVEYVWALIFDALRPRVYLDRPLLSEQFHEHRRTCCANHQLGELTLGILGMGRIGRRIAQVASAFGMRVLCNDLLPPAALGFAAGQAGTFVDAATLWRETDILTVHVDGRPENRRLINAEVLSQLKSSCSLINTSRGTVVDAAALADWAQRVQERGGRAILDVHDPEPPPANYALWGLPNVHLLPHLASRTATAMANMSWVVRDVVKVLEGEEPQWAAV